MGKEREGRTTGLFCRQLDDLRRAFRRYKVVHVICDNAANHKPDKSRVVRAYLAEWGDRVRVHFLPTYAPDTNPIERFWWRLHEAVTRNHRCGSLTHLIDLTFDWLEEWRFFRVKDSTYTALKIPGTFGQGGSYLANRGKMMRTGIKIEPRNTSLCHKIVGLIINGQMV